MRFIKQVAFFCIAFFAMSTCFAETVTGCRIGNNNYLYTGYQGVQPFPVSQYYIPTFPTYTTPTKDFLPDIWYNNYSSCPRFLGNPSYGAQCAVQGVTIVANGWVQNLGSTITYTITYNCPIDTYIFVLLTVVAITSALFIRKRIL